MTGEWKRFTVGSDASWHPIFPGRRRNDPPSDVGVTELSNPERFFTDGSAFEQTTQCNNTTSHPNSSILRAPPMQISTFLAHHCRSILERRRPLHGPLSREGG